MYRYKHTIGTFQLPYSGETSTEGHQSETLQSSSKSPNKVIHSLWIDKSYLHLSDRRSSIKQLCPNLGKKAERRYLEKIFPDRTPEQRQKQQPFLSKFTTSPAFRKESRFGNFRFTFSLSDLLMMYSQQICDGKQPVLRVYETVVYKQEIMYTVLVHSPDNKEFEKYPVLGDGSDDALCAYMRGNIVWRAQAMSKTHDFGLAIDEVNQNVGTEGGGNAWYMWDHVTLAFHLPEGQALHFDMDIVIKNLTTCDADEMFIGVKCRRKGHECVGTCPCGKCLVPLATADEIVEGISCDYKTNC
uniref:uncharacterized protein LOC124019522 isoform X3 n=1 Tax=Oncorhynchus gorbuscha TaxID=8017 RepID=UPI001EAEB905|nr:uncharacterized protein LOC124019522 isoform X3 [Oncorhynchus gorbuscha]